MKKRITSKLWRCCLVVIPLLFSNNIFAQDLVNVQLRVTGVNHNFQCGTDGFFSDPEPRYRVNAQTVHLGTGGGFTGLQIINLGTSSCGFTSQNISLFNFTGTCADQIQVEVDMWEEDDCGSDNSFNTGCFNDDENRTFVSPTFALSSFTQGIAQTFSVSGSGGYRVDFEVIWTEVAAPTLDAASVTSNCNGGTVNLLANIAQTVGGFDFYWYPSAVSTSALFVGSPYTPTVAGNTSYFVAYGNGTCETQRLQVNVTEVTSPTPSVTGGNACAGTSASLSAVAAGAIGFNWYDDAVQTTLLGSGPTFSTPPLSGSTNFFATAVYAGGCESATVPVLATELASPPAPSAPNLQVCSNLDAILTGTGTGGTLNWYTVPTSGSSIGSGTALNVGVLAVGTSTYYVAEDNGTCEGTRTAVVVTVNPLPNVPIALDQIICLGATATLTASEPSAINFNWYTVFPLTTPVSTGSVYNTSPIIAPTTYYVTSIDANNCESDTTEVLVDVNTVVAPTASSVSICPGDTAVLSAVAAGATQIRWYQNSDKTGFLVAGANYTTSPLLSNATYYVTAVYSNGCESLVTAVSVGVSAAPTVPATLNISLCESDSAIFTAFGSGGVISWYDAVVGGTLLETGSTYNAGILSPGTMVVYASEGNGTCASAPVAALATVNPSPSAPTVNTDTVCAGTSALLSVGGATGNFNWYSDTTLASLVFVGSNFSTTALNANTTYYVTEVNASNCQSPSTRVDVVVDAVPVAPFATPDTVCEGNTATLSASNAGGTTNWYSNATGTNMVGTGTSFTTPVLNQNMTYYVREISAEGCESPLVDVTALINILPNRPSANAIVVCEGDDVILSATGSGTGDLVFFDNVSTEIGRTTMSLAVPTATLNLGPLAIGTYVYSVQEENSGCESANESINVTVSALPAAPVAINDGPVCEGDVIILQATPAVTGGIFSWTGPGGFVSNNQTITLFDVATAQVGTYTVNVTIGSCTSADGTTAIVVNPKPALAANVTNNGPLCEGDNLTITAPTVANVSYAWTGPNGFTDTGNPVTINAVNASSHQGVYGVAVTDNTTGCASDNQFSLVQVNELPAANMVLTNSPVCEGNDVTLSVPQVFGATYAWTAPNGFTAATNTPTISNATTADADVYTVVIAVAGCAVSLSTTVAVNTEPVISMIGDTTIMEGDNIVMYASGGISYLWSPASFLSNANLPTPILSGASIGTHPYVVNVTNSEGCTSVDSVTVTVVPQTQLDIVDLFTPNDDGVNDSWEINFLQNVGNYTIQIFSRGGVEVFRTQNYQNDWYGTYDGNMLPEGTYYYIIETDAKVFKGPVTIKR